MNDIYYIALAYYQQQQYERALEILNRKKTLNQSVQCRYVAALCSVTMQDFECVSSLLTRPICSSPWRMALMHWITWVTKILFHKKKVGSKCM